MSHTRRNRPYRDRAGRRRSGRRAVVRELHRLGIVNHRQNRTMRAEAQLAAERCRSEATCA